MNSSANIAYCYLLSPLHTGGTTQEGNLLGIAREAHTDLPYIPSSTIRGRLRSLFGDDRLLERVLMFGPDLKDLQNTELTQQYKERTKKDLNQLEQGDLWIGDGSLLWVPVPSLSHSIVWISCPQLLRRWKRLNPNVGNIPTAGHYYLKEGSKTVYLKDARITLGNNQALSEDDKKRIVPDHPEAAEMERLLILPDAHCATLIQMSLWRQVKVKLNESKSVEGGFRYEEAIPPDTVMYFPWGTTSQANATAQASVASLGDRLRKEPILQIGGQESLGRGFVELWSSALENTQHSED